MFDTMTLTKAGAGLFAAWLFLLLANWAGEGLYHVDDHGEQAYAIEVDDGPAEVVEEVPFAEVYAVADASRGERLWRQCQACHQLEAGQNGTGPYLYGVVGRTIGAAEGFGYSDVLAGHGGDWTPENLSGFLENPRSWAPGTKMSYAGMRDAEDRANLIAYMATFGG